MKTLARLLLPAVLMGTTGPAVAADARAVSIGTFDHPVYVASAAGQPSLLFVVEQPGRVQVLRNETRLSQPFLDITSLVSFGGERGLLSIAFPPNYQTSRRFYVAFTNPDGDVELDEFRLKSVGATRADPASRRVVLKVPHPGAANHNGGQLQFGPKDAMLYMSVGDGGNLSSPGAPARDVQDLRGKILRINPSPSGSQPYTIPPDNPYVGKPGRDEIYAYGLRNPWRFSFDGDRIIIADVGQASWEEVNFLPRLEARGVNFGWPQYEANAIFNNSLPGPDPAVFPMFTYSHDVGRCAIIGGSVVRDAKLTNLIGRYLYGDLCTGELRTFMPHIRVQTATNDRSAGVSLPNLAGFGLGHQQQIYAVQVSGNISRLVPP